MKRFLLLAVSIAALSLISCPPDQGPADTKVIDQRLIDGYYWEVIVRQSNNYYFYDNNDSGIIYKFTRTEIIKGHRKNTQPYGFVPDTPIRAYTDNGCIYSYANDALLFNYTTNAYPVNLDSYITAANNGNQQTMLPNMTTFRNDAKSGKIISMQAEGGGTVMYFLNSTGQYLHNYTW
jgi:hypothetical protein